MKPVFLCLLVSVFFLNSSAAHFSRGAMSAKAGSLSALKAVPLSDSLRNQIQFVQPKDKATAVKLSSPGYLGPYIIAGFKKNLPIALTDSTIFDVVTIRGQKVHGVITVGKKSISFAPDKEPLKPGETYYVVLANVNYANGEKLVGPYSWMFTMENEPAKK